MDLIQCLIYDKLDVEAEQVRRASTSSKCGGICHSWYSKYVI